MTQSQLEIFKALNKCKNFTPNLYHLPRLNGEKNESTQRPNNGGGNARHGEKAAAKSLDSAKAIW